MAHRIEVELTSHSDDSTWTWRAVGAKQPRGAVAASLVPEGSQIGTVLRAEVETTLDGTTVLGLLPLKGKANPKRVETIELLATTPTGPDVNVVLASKGKGRRRPEWSEDSRGDRRGSRSGSPRSAGASARGKTAAEARPDRAKADEGKTVGAAGDGRAPSTSRPARPARGGDRTAPGGTRRNAPGREGPRRPAASTTYRNAALATLKPEQIPVAEQLLRGGIPSVRQAIEEQNARARSEGRAEVTPGPLLALAEELLPVVTLAAWKDRASAARAGGKDVPLRELRSIVAAAATVSLDEEGRELVTSLRTMLDQRVTALRERWVERITVALDEGRVADAVRTSIRSPEPATRLSAELAVRLADEAGKAMSADREPADWLAVLEVVVDSPVRRNVKPAGIPAAADEALLAAARQASGFVPELARLLGIPIPPPPGPRRPVPARPVATRRTA